MAEAFGLARDVAEAHEPLEGVDAVVCPPAIWLTTVAQAVIGTRLQVGAQTMHAEERGAFTGETSPLMLRGLASHVILGHSERRQYDNETDERRGPQGRERGGARPAPDRGHRRAHRRAAGGRDRGGDRPPAAGGASPGSTPCRAAGWSIAYEPVWAIGTGEAAAPADAQAVAAQIRAILRERFGADADGVPILYGGSVTADNAAELLRAARCRRRAGRRRVAEGRPVRRDPRRSRRGRAGERPRPRRPRRPRRLRAWARPDAQRADGRRHADLARAARHLAKLPPRGVGRGGRPAGGADGQLGGRPSQPGGRLSRAAGPAAHQRGDRRRHLRRQCGAQRGHPPRHAARRAGSADGTDRAGWRARGRRAHRGRRAAGA